MVLAVLPDVSWLETAVHPLHLVIPCSEEALVDVVDITEQTEATAAVQATTPVITHLAGTDPTLAGKTVAVVRSGLVAHVVTRFTAQLEAVDFPRMGGHLLERLQVSVARV